MSKRLRKIFSYFSSSSDSESDSNKEDYETSNVSAFVQTGKGVTTRKQAKLQQNVLQPNQPSNVPVQGVSVPNRQRQLSQDSIEEPLPGPSNRQSGSQTASDEDETISRENVNSRPQSRLGNNDFEVPKTVDFDKFKLYIQKQDHKRQKRFNLEDHLYVMKVQLKQGTNPPLLRDVVDLIYESMVTVIDDLKHHLSDTQQNLIYVTMKQPGMNNALRSGAFILETTDADTILHFMMNMLNRFLQSDSQLRLDQGFTVWFKTFSYNHINWVDSRRKTGPLRLLGALLNMEITIYGCPRFVETVEKEFFNYCVLTSVIIGSLLNKSQRNEDSSHKANFNIISSLWSKTKLPIRLQNSAVQLLRTELKMLINELHLPENGPYDPQHVLPLVAKHYDSQIIIIRSTQSRIANFLSWPENWDPNLEQIFLFEATVDHVIPITNLHQFFLKNSAICFYCKRTYHYKTRHMCAVKTEHCQDCYKPLKPENDQHLLHQPFKFCDSKGPNKAMKVLCPKCNVSFKTKACFENHKSGCYVKGWFCQKCKFFDKKVKDPTAHQCLETKYSFCYFCKEKYNKEEMKHICLLKPETGSRSWPQLIFFSFEFTSMDQSKCVQCYKVKESMLETLNLTWADQVELNKYHCSVHSTFGSKEIPNLCTLLIEDREQRGTFEEVTFADDLLQLDVSKSSFTFDYDPHGLRPGKPQRQIKRVSNELFLVQQQLQRKEEKTALDYFLLFLLNGDRRNSSFISLNLQNDNLTAVLSILQTYNLSPEIVKKENSFILLKLEKLNISFVNASNYFNANYEDLLEQFQINEEPTFFPLGYV